MGLFVSLDTVITSQKSLSLSLLYHRVWEYTETNTATRIINRKASLYTQNNYKSLLVEQMFANFSNFPFDCSDSLQNKLRTPTLLFTNGFVFINDPEYIYYQGRKH